MAATRESRLYEVYGKVRDDGRKYDTHLCGNCGGYLGYLPTAWCHVCGYIDDMAVVKAPEGFVAEYRDQIKQAAEFHNFIVALELETVLT